MFLKTRFSLILSLIFFSPLVFAGSFLNWNIEFLEANIDGYKAKIRTGYLAANPSVAFKGNIVYLQGLGDSMLNHDPLFEVLVNDGYRVISFDYMGQGGSSGSMNHTTIQNINALSDVVFSKLARLGSANGGKYHLIGWSTGGLASYRKAFLDKGKTISSVVLLAPGIYPNYIVGEGFRTVSRGGPIDEISLRTLTNNRFEGVNDPHEDGIRPISPLYVPKFAINLQLTAKIARKTWKISKKVRGLVLFSGPNDNYVNARKSKKVLRKKASHFKSITYKKALHEIDNEVPEIAEDARKQILSFLNGE